MKLLNFGSCNIDYVYRVNHIAAPGETISALSMELFPGGKGLNQSIAAARAGARIFHAGCIGEDAKMLEDIFTESGVDLTHLKKVTAKNGHAIIQVDDRGENCIFVFEGTNGMITESFIDEVLLAFEEGDALLLQNEISNVPYLIEKAHQRKMKIFFNPSPFRPELKSLDLNKLHCLILNEVEAKEFTGSDTPEEVISYLLQTYPDLKIMLTLGKRGCIYADRDTFLPHPAFAVTAVDTTAAGDTFTGYFVSQLSKGADVARAVTYATAASAISVSRMGAAPSIPTMDEVEQLLPTLQRRDA